eukprot:TRINITY_DN18292_c0_g1_i1.p1 TRINITY_DN18292_c0_g1~~TRINITY_DN18292_c0_g1_i1.p1  ORF type:complete len:327 (+),score=79.40 TRINITY_DN18292_c0_g1_i1:44-982(+)
MLSRRWTVHRRALALKQRALPLSLAFLFHALLTVCLWVLPFLIAFATPSFWVKEGYYYEVPRTHFKHQLVAMFEGPGTLLTWSTVPEWNSLQSAHLRLPSVKAREVDNNYDGITDEFHASVAMPLVGSESITHVYAMLLFQYDLKDRIRLAMETAIYVDEANSAGDHSVLTVQGDMHLAQRRPLNHRAHRTIYNTTDLFEDMNGDFASVLYKYHIRNETTQIYPKYTFWGTYDEGVPQPSLSQFKLVLQLKIPQQRVIYQPGFFETMKFGWVQYMAVFWLVWGVFYVVRWAVFGHFLLDTYCVYDRIPNKDF